jgi:hypothetical protein
MFLDRFVFRLHPHLDDGSKTVTLPSDRNGHTIECRLMTQRSSASPVSHSQVYHPYCIFNRSLQNQFQNHSLYVTLFDISDMKLKALLVIKSLKMKEKLNLKTIKTIEKKTKEKKTKEKKRKEKQTKENKRKENKRKQKKSFTITSFLSELCSNIP